MPNNSTLIEEVTVDPMLDTNGVPIYSKDVTGTKQLFARPSDGSVYQLTPAGGTPGAAVYFDTVLNKTFSGGLFGRSDDINLGTLGKRTLIMCDCTGQSAGQYTGFQGGVDGIVIGMYRRDRTGQHQGFGCQSTFSSAANRINNTSISSGIEWYASHLVLFVYVGAISRWAKIQTAHG